MKKLTWQSMSDYDKAVWLATEQHEKFFERRSDLPSLKEFFAVTLSLVAFCLAIICLFTNWIL